jgi:hypothetical protein
MRYTEFKRAIQARLQSQPSGSTWKQLRADLHLPYDRPCPEWTRRLEQEINLVRRKSAGNALVWAVKTAADPSGGPLPMVPDPLS